VSESPPTTEQSSTPISFESAFEKIDLLLKKLNSAETSLEESLQCYEEADRLIAFCNGRLNSAERRIEKLIKQRSGEIEHDDQGHPKTEPLSSL
jgi:exodeoxyribonuclease VII small subunit